MENHLYLKEQGELPPGPCTTLATQPPRVLKTKLRPVETSLEVPRYGECDLCLREQGELPLGPCYHSPCDTPPVVKKALKKPARGMKRYQELTDI